MIRKAKKGFTIVELVIVIAVIGVLAAVLIPTFISLNKKAEEKADNALVRNINNALRIEEAQEGKNETLHDAVLDLDDYGYKLANLVSKSGQKLIWDQEKDEFILDNGGHNDINFWEIRSSMPAEGNKRSIYAGNNWNEPAVGGEEGINYGFDAGYNTNIESISYKNTGAAKTSTIRTNGGTLTINAANDTVKHYGNADSVNIIAVASTSYHENGEVGYAKIATGRLVVEKEAQIEGIYLVANESGEFDNIKLAVVGGATLPELARADVELNEGESKLVVEVQTLATSEGTDPDPEYVWISKSGSEVSAVVSSSDNASDYAEHVVVNPSAAAEATKETVEEPAAEIDDTSIARIGAVGFTSFKAAVEAAKYGEKIYLLKDFTLSNSIGRYSDTDIYDGLYEGSLANEVVLTKDITITFSSYSPVNLTVGGRFTVDGHKLTLAASSAYSGSGIINCQQVVDEDGNRHGITIEGSSVIVSDDLYFNLDPLRAPFTFDLVFNGTTWTEGSGFSTGSYSDIRMLTCDPILKGELSVEVGSSANLSVTPVEGATYRWSFNDTTNMFGYISDDENTCTWYSTQASPMGGDLTRLVFCDVIGQDGLWTRNYWVITIPGNGGGFPSMPIEW